MNYQFQIEENELWWGGTASSGTSNPFCNKSSFEADFRRLAENQTMPMFLSNHGRIIWSDEPFAVKIADGKFNIEGENVTITKMGDTLKEAYIAAQKAHFPANGEKLNDEFFLVPQYNTWMQFTYLPTQEGVLNYAKDILNNGFPPGILIIDEGWHTRYGTWEFDLSRFPDPKGMVDKLHEMGFKVMLWVVPYFCADGKDFISRMRKDLNPETYNETFLRTDKGDVAIIHWWNGYSAILDMTKKCDRDYLNGKLKGLMKDYGVDGFKFDGGTLENYTESTMINGAPDKSATPAERNIAWNDFGLKYEFHEYKDTFKGGGKNAIQRMQDRLHSWDTFGINTLLPNALLQGLLGHPFICPDMVGGGEWTCRELKTPVDEELFVRMAQCSALFPMMQFSWAPWEAVSNDHLNMICDMAHLHQSVGETILKLVRSAEQSGEPILRNLEYNYPNQGYGKITDQFMLGEDILVAPVVTKGTFRRDVVLPGGKWEEQNTKEVYDGEKIVTLDAPLDTLLWFKQV